MNEKDDLNVFEWLIAAIMCVILVVTTLNVVARYVVKAPLFWSDEFNVTLYVWIVFIGIAVATKNQENMSIDFFMSFIPEKLRNIVALIIKLLVMATIVFIFVGGVYMTRMAAMQRSPSLPITRMWAFIPIPISCVLMFYYELKHTGCIVKRIIGKKGGSE